MIIMLRFLYLKHIKSVLLSGLILASSPALAGSAADLRETYKEIETDIFNNNYGSPLYLKSSTSKNSMRGDIYGVFYHPYKTVSKNLATLPNWCDIMPQHLNIKACTYQYVKNQCRLNFYSGRKFYEKADDVYRLDYQFKVAALNERYFNAALNSKEGPLNTKDYIINVEAIPLTDSSTFFHLSYEYKYGFLARIAMTSYFSTLGRNKVGFTAEGTNKDGQPLYIKGFRGVIERNAMRYYFSIQSFLETQQEPLETRFKKRISHWYDLTETHHKQLYEMDKKDYLKYKTMERQDQKKLQKEIYKNKKEIISIPKSVKSCA